MEKRRVDRLEARVTPAEKRLVKKCFRKAGLSFASWVVKKAKEESGE